MKNFAIPIAVSLAIFVLFTVASRTKVQKDEKDNIILKYPTTIKLLGLGFLILGCWGTLFVTNTAIQKDDKDIILLVLTCSFFFVLLPLSLLLEFFYAKYLINDKSIHSDTPWTRKREIKWKDVTEIRYSKSLRLFVIRNNKTKPIRVGGMVAGVNALLSIIEQQVSSDIYTKLLDDLK